MKFLQNTAEAPVTDYRSPLTLVSGRLRGGPQGPELSQGLKKCQQVAKFFAGECAWQAVRHERCRRWADFFDCSRGKSRRGAGGIAQDDYARCLLCDDAANHAAIICGHVKGLVALGDRRTRKDN